MALEEMIRRQITGIRPFNELPVDAEIWREAHGQHHLHRQLHAAGAHRPGVVYGLEVIASTSRECTIVVAPGVGVESTGQTIVLSEPVSFTIDQPGQIYITLSFLRAVDRNSGIAVGGGQQYYREVEGRDLKQTKELPTTPYIELARLSRSGADKPIRDAANPFSPTKDELNLLHRPVAFPHCVADVEVGELTYVPKTAKYPWNPNRAGLWNILREGHGRGFHLTFTGPINLRAQPGGGVDPALLYVAGQQGFQPLAEAEVTGLTRFLENGGTLFAEAIAGDTEFAAGFQDLAVQLGARLQEIGKGHPLLTSHHLFPSWPTGSQNTGRIQADSDAGVFLSTFNYGGAWQGEVEKPEAPDARERVRQAQEFGLNIVAYASQRRRSRQLSRLS